MSSAPRALRTDSRTWSRSWSSVQSLTATPKTGTSSRPARSSRYSATKVIFLARSPVTPNETKASAGCWSGACSWMATTSCTLAGRPQGDLQSRRPRFHARNTVDTRREDAGRVTTLSELQVPRLGECRFDSPLGKYVAGRRTNEHYVDEDDRVLFDDTVELLRARQLPLDELPTSSRAAPGAGSSSSPAPRGSASSPAAASAPASTTSSAGWSSSCTRTTGSTTSSGSGTASPASSPDSDRGRSRSHRTRSPRSTSRAARSSAARGAPRTPR